MFTKEEMHADQAEFRLLVLISKYARDPWRRSLTSQTDHWGKWRMRCVFTINRFTTKMPRECAKKTKQKKTFFTRNLPEKEREILSCFHVTLRPRRQDGLLGTGTEWERDERVKGSTAETVRKGPWTAARTMEVLRRCPLAIAQRLVHCAIAVSTAVLDRVTKTMSVAQKGKSTKEANVHTNPQQE